MKKQSIIFPDISSSEIPENDIKPGGTAPSAEAQQKYDPTTSYSSAVIDDKSQRVTSKDFKSNPHTHINGKISKRICLFRSLLVLCLLTAGAISATLSFLFIRDYEHKLYEEEFSSIVNDIYETVDKGLANHVELLAHFSGVMGYICPKNTSWPNCSVPTSTYTILSSSLLNVGDSRSVGVAPIVQPHQKEEFEAFAYDFFESDGGFPPTTGISQFGKGIYKRVNGTRVPDMTGNTSFSRYANIFVPIFLVSDVPNNYPGIMFNMHSEYYRSLAIDATLDCSKIHPGMSCRDDCTSISDVIQLVSDKKPSPASVMYTPIYPLDAPKGHVVGFATLIFNWVNLLRFTIPFGSNIYCMIRTKTAEYVFLVGGKNTTYLGQDNSVKFASTFDTSLRTSRVVVAEGELLATTEYQLIFIPHMNFYHEYHSNLPIYACVTCVLIILVISIIFILFDFFTKREAAKNVALLDSKRIFVRFISHEIRSPLNTIVLGLSVLRDKVRKIESESLKPSKAIVNESLLSDVSESSNRTIGEKSNQSDDQLRNEIAECFEIIQELNENSEAAVVVLNDLINYDKIELKTFTIEKKEVNVGRLLEKTYTSLLSQAKHKNIHLSYHIDRSKNTSHKITSIASDVECKSDLMTSFIILGDSVKLCQVFRNIISNALKLTPNEGKVAISVKCTESDEINDSKNPSTKHHQSYFHVSISDTGPGLSQEQLNMICSEGVQFNPNELQAGGGSGLGLWITQQIIDLHGGKLTVMSKGLGYGATFEIKLPLLKIVTEASTTTTTPQSNIPQIENDSRPQYISIPNRVLIVDDTPSNRKMLGRILKTHSIVYDEAENGEICLTKVMAHGGHITETIYDLILMDYEMPILNGPKAAQKLRQLGYNKLIFGVTGNVLPEDREYFMQHGVDAVLPKPVTIQALMEVYEKFQN